MDDRQIGIESGQEVLAAIRGRRSVGAVRAERPPRHLIEMVVEAGRWAPNHHLSEPWRFIVLAGAARDTLGAAMADALADGLAGNGAEALDEQARQRLLDRERHKPLRAPVVIVVAVEPSSDPQIVPSEDVLAGAAAVQNMLLAAEAVGLAAIWRTGPAAYASPVKAALDLSPTTHIIGFLYMGYPSGPAGQGERSNGHGQTRWLGWE